MNRSGPITELCGIQCVQDKVIESTPFMCTKIIISPLPQCF